MDSLFYIAQKSKMSRSLFIVILSIVSLNGFSQYYPDLDIYCSEIAVTKNDNPGETKYTTPFDNTISFKKLVNGGKEVYYMTISTLGQSETTGKGILIELGQGYSIEKDIATKVYQDEENRFIHYAEFSLSKDDVSKLKNYLIKSYRIYVYNSPVENTTKYQGYMYCLSTM